MYFPINEDHLQGARVLLAPQYRNISDQDLRNYLLYLTSSLSEEDAESFFSDLGNTFKSVGKEVLKAVPTIAPILGSAAGTLIGGPVGAQIGSTLGNTVGQFAGSIGSGHSVTTALKSAAGAGAQGLLNTATGLLGNVLPGGAGNLLGAAGGAGGAAAAGGIKPSAMDLQQFLRSPAVSNSISSLLMGALGQKSVPVQAGGQTASFNPSQILNTLSMLAQRAADEAAEDAEDTGIYYMLNPDGSYAIDPANPEQRAMQVFRWTRRNMLESQQRSVEVSTPQQKNLTQWLRESGLIVN
jgi:hypothetical protein